MKPQLRVLSNHVNKSSGGGGVDVLWKIKVIKDSGSLWKLIKINMYGQQNTGSKWNQKKEKKADH